MEFRVLGPLEVRDQGESLPLGAPRARTVLAILLTSPNALVSVDELVDELWPDHPPDQARELVYGYVSRVRRALRRGAAGGDAADRLITRKPGYLLRVADQELDRQRYERLLAGARAAADAGELEPGLAMYQDLARLWRGAPFADVSPTAAIGSAIASLHELRLTGLEDQYELALRLDRGADTIADLTALVATHPLRERAVSLLMRALSGSGRTADALALYRRTRQRLADELGIDPGAELQRHQVTILRGETGETSETGNAGPAGPSRLPAIRPAQLPADVAGFTGRATDLARLDRHLPDLSQDEPPAAVVITAIGGTAGVGKTALAVHWAHRIADRFPDGHLYVNLRGYDPDEPVTPAEVLARFLAALGVPCQDIPMELDERAARYRTEVAGRRMLIVLDNAGSVEQARPLLPGSGSCLVVVTSRDSLSGLVAVNGAHRLDLDLLPAAEAVSLLRRLIGPRVDAEPGAAAALAEQCARLPLALRVAAELAVSRPATSLADLVGELDNQQRRLELLDAGGDPHAAVRVVFSWSIQQLPPAAARTFRLLGLHPGPDFDPYAVAALTGASLAQARDTMATLTRAHLLHTTGTDRRGMHDLLRAYAAHLTTSADPEPERHAALERLFDYYLATASAATVRVYPAEAHQRPRIPVPAAALPELSDAAAATAWLEADRACLVAVVAHAATHGWPAHAIRLSSTLHRFLDHHHRTDALTVHNHGYRAAERAGDRRGQAQALRELGAVQLQLARYGPAADYLQQALAQFRQVGDRAGEAGALTSLGIVEQRMGRAETAAAHLQAALGTFQQAGHVHGEASARQCLGVVEAQRGRYQHAADQLQRALRLFRQVGDRTEEAIALNNLGSLQERLGRYEAATVHLEQALELSRELGYPQAQAHTLDSLGVVYLRRGDPVRAAEHFRLALTGFQEIGDQDGAAMARNGLGEAVCAAGHPADALTHHRDALAIATGTGTVDEQARAHAGLGDAHRALGDTARARSHYQAALTGYRRTAMPDADRVQARIDALDHPTVAGQGGPSGP